jgi:hypothetical protein
MEVRDVTHWTVGVHQHAERLKAQEAILANLRNEFNAEMIKGAGDDTRIRRLGGEALPP